jgi:hypothetical protein
VRPEATVSVSVGVVQHAKRHLRRVSPAVLVPLSPPAYEELALYPAHFVDLIENDVPLIVVEQQYTVAVDTVIAASVRVGRERTPIIVLSIQLIRALMIDVLRMWRPDLWPVVINITSLLLQLGVLKGGVSVIDEIKTKLAEAKSSMAYDFVACLSSIKVTPLPLH